VAAGFGLSMARFDVGAGGGGPAVQSSYGLSLVDGSVHGDVVSAAFNNLLRVSLVDGGELPFAEMLCALQAQAATAADWEALEPALDRLAELLAPEDARELVTVAGDDWWLELGAVDFVAKPKLGLSDGLRGLANDIVDKIRVAAAARVDRRAAPRDDRAATPLSPLGRLSTEKIIFLGASTGGTEATREVLTELPADCPAVMITQHMPPGFTKSYAARLDGLCRIRVAEARDGERVLPGHAYIAPGGLHLSVDRSGANYLACVRDTEPVNRHKPSVEVLFLSAARVVGPNSVGVMLTGMGADGAQAMKVLRDAGSYNLAQDESTCVVFGMPKEAIAAGAVHEVLPLPAIAPRLIERLRSPTGSFNNRL
jgi:two-component system chemotaxis response regulator CheB